MPSSLAPTRRFYKKPTFWVVTALLAATGGAGYWFQETPQVQSVLAVIAPSLANPPVKPAGAGGGAGGAGTGAGGAARRFGGGVQPVTVDAVRVQDMRVMVGGIGNFAASNTAAARVQVSAQVKTLHFKEGQWVSAGQLLATLDDRAFQVALAQTEGQLASLTAQLDNAKGELTRYRDLLAKDAIAKQQVDTQEAQVAQLSGSIKASQAARDAAKLQLSYTQVQSPIAGRVGLKNLDVGSMAQPSDANGVVSIVQTRPIALVFAVPAAHIRHIARSLRSNKPLEVQAFDRTGKVSLGIGKIDSIDNTIDASTDTIKVKALFPNRDDALFANQGVSVQLQLDTIEQAVVVPQAAVLRGAQGFYVFALNADNTVSVKPVRPGATDAGMTAVNALGLSAPLKDGDTVVVDGVDRLREGAKVEVIATDPRKRQGAAPPPRGPRGAGGTGTPSAAAGSTAAGNAAPVGSTVEATQATSSGKNNARLNLPSSASPVPNAAPNAAPNASQSPAPNTGAKSGAGERPQSPAGRVEGGATAPADGAAPARPPWFDKLPPALQEKLKAMSPEERRAWVTENRDKLRAAAQQNQ